MKKARRRARAWKAWALTNCDTPAKAKLGIWPPTGRLALFDTELNARAADDDHVMPVVPVTITEILPAPKQRSRRT